MFQFASRSRAQPDAPPAAPEPEATSPGSAELVARARARLGLVGACGAGAVALAVVALAQVTPVYSARVQILIDPADLRVVENDVTPRSPLADSGVSIAESQVRVIGSDNVLRRVVASLGLQDDPEFARPLPASDGPVETIKRALGLGAPPGLSRDPALRAVEELRGKVAIRRPERTFVIEVLVRSRGAEKSALIANTIAEVYTAEEVAARAKSASRVSDALASRLNEQRLALQAAEQRLAKFREDNRLVATNGRLLADQQLGELSQQLIAASIRTADVRARADQARQIRIVNGTSLPEMLQSTEMRALRQQLADLARQKAENGIRLGPRHPAVAEQSAQIRELEAAIAREKTRIIDSTGKELDRAVSAEAAIRRELERLTRETTVNDRASIGLREFERDVDTQRTVYEAFLRRTREVGQQERLDTTNMRVISSATPALGRSWPPSPTVILPLALLLGLALGTGLAVLRPVAGPRRALALVPVPAPQRA